MSGWYVAAPLDGGALMGLFTDRDLVAMAIQMEENGQAFYSRAADRLADGRAKDLLRRLARDEAEHRETFDRLLSGIGAAQSPESHAGEDQDYVRAHLESQVFSRARMDQLLGQASVPERAALQLGIDSEKDSILFYSEMKSFVSGSAHPVVDRIIGEEREHFSALVELLKAAG
jgi:rubrerythrin